MQKNQAYHQSAVKYNEVLAAAAEELAPTLEDETVKKWCTAVGKQHRFHAKRHKSALSKILSKEEAPPVESLPDGLDVPEPTEDLHSTEQEPQMTAETERDVPVPTDNLEVPFEQEHTATSVVTEDDPAPSVEEKLVAGIHPDAKVFEDGCVDSHQPMERTCQFYPNKKSDDNG